MFLKLEFTQASTKIFPCSTKLVFQDVNCNNVCVKSWNLISILFTDAFLQLLIIPGAIVWEFVSNLGDRLRSQKKLSAFTRRLWSVCECAILQDWKSKRVVILALVRTLMFLQLPNICEIDEIFGRNTECGLWERRLSLRFCYSFRFSISAIDLLIVLSHSVVFDF